MTAEPPGPAPAAAPDEGPVVAAGGVVWRRDGDRLLVAVVHRPKYDDWSLPKGKQDPGEHIVRTALREVEEETGFQVVLGRPLGITAYLVVDGPVQRRKEVHWWAAPAVSGGFVPTSEVDVLEWHDVDGALQRLDRESEQDVVRRFAAGPADTVPLVVLRHGSARKRSGWKGSDEERPLRRDGRTQAEALVDLLAAWRPTDVVTSPARRCRETVAPFVAAHDGGERCEAALSEGGHGEDAAPARALTSELLAGGRSVLLCSHRPVLPTLLAVLAESAEAREAAELLRAAAEDDPLHAAELVVVHHASGRVVSAERHRP